MSRKLLFMLILCGLMLAACAGRNPAKELIAKGTMRSTETDGTTDITFHADGTYDLTRSDGADEHGTWEFVETHTYTYTYGWFNTKGHSYYDVFRLENGRYFVNNEGFFYLCRFDRDPMLSELRDRLSTGGYRFIPLEDLTDR